MRLLPGYLTFNCYDTWMFYLSVGRWSYFLYSPVCLDHMLNYDYFEFYDDMGNEPFLEQELIIE